MGLLGTLIGKLLGRSPDEEHAGASAQDEQMDRLSRIAQRGRGETAPKPSYGAGPAEGPSPLDLVPPPGAGEAPASWDEAQAMHEPTPGAEPYELNEPYAEPQPDMPASDMPDEPPADAIEATPEPFAPAEHGPQPAEPAMDMVPEPQPFAEPQPDVISDEPPAPQVGEAPPSLFDEIERDPAFAPAQEPTGAAPPLAEEPGFAELPGEDRPFADEPADVADAAPSVWPDEEAPAQAVLPAGYMPSEGPADEPLAAPPGFMPEPPEEPEEPEDAEDALPFAAKGGRRSSLGLTPMTAGEDDEEEEEEDGEVFGNEAWDDDRDDDDDDDDEDEDDEDEDDDDEDDDDDQDDDDDEDDDDDGDDDDDADAEDEDDDEDRFDGEAVASIAPVAAAAIAPGARSAVVFRQIFPPMQGQSLSFFGGAPIASPAFAWPRPAAGGAPFSFLMQVDCAAVPERARMGMPGRGILYVFMDLTWGQQDAYRILHEDAPAEALTEIAPPDDLPAAFGEEARHIWNWPRRDEDLPRLLPRWPFEPEAIELPAEAWSEADAGDEDAAYLWPGGALVNAQLLSAQGEDIASDHFGVTDFIAADGTMTRPFAAFPHDARAVQIVTGLLLRQLDHPTFSTRAAELEALSEEERAAMFERIRTEAQEWYDDAAVEQPFGPVPQEVADQFWTWLGTFPWLVRFVLSEALTLSIEASLAGSPEAAARVPDEIARKVRSRHALAVRTDDGLHVNIPDRMLAPPVDVQGHQAERARSHILLLEISSNAGLGHHFGEGVCQFWITPEDLAAGRFDKVELTADAS